MSRLSCQVGMGGIWELLDGKIWEWELSFRWEWEWRRWNGRELVQKICYHTIVPTSTYGSHSTYWQYQAAAGTAQLLIWVHSHFRHLVGSESAHPQLTMSPVRLSRWEHAPLYMPVGIYCPWMLLSFLSDREGWSLVGIEDNCRTTMSIQYPWPCKLLLTRADFH